MHGGDVNRYGFDLLWTLCTWFLQDLVTGVDSWSISELVHAIVIMAHYHALAGFALGCGVNPEIDTPLGHTGMGKDGELQLVKIPFCSNPALGVGDSTPAQSDSESEPLSPVPRSPTHPGVSESLVQHYIESE
jgi:sestrin